MAHKEVHLVDANEMIRLWQKGLSLRRIGALTNRSRVTVTRYVNAAREMGLTRDGPAPAEEQLAALAALNLPGPKNAAAPSAQALEPQADQIKNWLCREKLQLTRVHELLGDRAVKVSYSSLQRFVAARGLGRRSGAPATMRLAETAPGQVIEMDFARLGRIPDPERERPRVVWMLLLVCSFSRHMFLWPLYRQRLEDVVQGLEQAWGFFGGVPHFLVIDNFPAAVAGADRYKPLLTRGFTEYAQHRGFVPDPTRPGRPRDKAKVENIVRFARERFFKGAAFAGLEDMRARARTWCEEVAGRRLHGTTRRRPLEVFLGEEQDCLIPYDGEPYEVASWQSATVAPDGHVQARNALYSIPEQLGLRGEQVEIRVERALVRIYHRSRLIKVHPRQGRGGRNTDPADLPEHKADYFSRDPEVARGKARQFGEAAAFYADALLGARPSRARINSVNALIKLGERFGANALDGACRRAIAVELYDIKRLKAVLLQGLERGGEEPGSAPPPGRFARRGSDFAARPLKEDDRDHFGRDDDKGAPR